MKIVNPLYDRAFKYLMDNETLTKKILSIIIDKEIISLESKPQETAVLLKNTQISVPRYDFKAIILTDKGERYTTLIEVQKSRSPNPIPRFRRYLGQNYAKKQTYTDKNGENKTEHLPIISIYILGYNIGTKEYDTPGILVQNSVIDAITKKPIKNKNKFINLLSHPCYILQVGRLRKERKTRLEKMLSLFDQSYRTDDKYILNLEDIDEEFADLANYLFTPTQDSAFIRSLNYEEDIAEELYEAKQKEQEAKQKEQEAKQKEQEAKQKIKEIKQKIKETATFLKKQNIVLSKISQMTGLDIKEIEKL